jgi:spermidine synthase
MLRMMETVKIREPKVAAAGINPLVPCFTAASFLGAFLLFQLEPMMAKMLLPSLGGSAAVWNTAMVFFQVALVLGYALAHLSLRGMRPAQHIALQLGLLLAVLLTLPIALPLAWRPPVDANPVWWTLLACLVMGGAAFVVLSTTGPTMQRWFSYTDHPRADDPYFLYAAGNVGSLLALLTYPLVVEPNLALSVQSLVWTTLFVIFLVLTMLCALAMLRHRRVLPEGDVMHPTVVGASPRMSARRQVWWVVLAAIPSALLLGVTRHLATDIASVPLLWVIPLALYLGTFILAFGRHSARMMRGSARAVRFLAIPLALTFIGTVPSLRIQLPIQLGAFAAAALLAHSRLAQDRPPASQLTRFFLLIAVGGAAGGVFAGLLAPVLFTSVLEYPIAFILALSVVPAAAIVSRRMPSRAARLVLASSIAAAAVTTVVIRSDGTQRSLTIAMSVAACALLVGFALTSKPVGFAAAVGVVLLTASLFPANPTLFVDRTFYGVHRVYADASGRHILLNGTTVHGIQNTVGGAMSDAPTAYYGAGGPFADVMTDVLQGSPRRLAVIGAGAGSVAAYLRIGDSLTFYEIDEAVVRIASDPSLFTYVHDAAGNVDFVLGDGRLELDRSAGGYDAVVVDAFSGDAIPTHLLTVEAVEVYVQRATQHGLVAFNISNRYFDLGPVLGRVADAEGLSGLIRVDPATSTQQQAEGALASTWVVLARSPSDLTELASEQGWVPLTAKGEAPLWTDDYTDILRTMFGAH